jgi:rRNA processing protein Gar1
MGSIIPYFPLLVIKYIGRTALKRLGVVEDISHRGLLIVRAPLSPAIGSKVLDRRSREIGRIAGLVGPVSRPFILIEPLKHGGRGAELLGSTVYLA